MNVLPSMPMCKAVPLSQYIEDKIDILQDSRGFGFKLKKHELAYLRELKSEMAVDRYVRDLFKKYL